MAHKHLAIAILFLAFTAYSGDNTITYANYSPHITAKQLTSLPHFLYYP